MANIEKLDSISIDTFIATLDPFKKEINTVDLTGVKLISPVALVQLAAICHALKREGREITIVLDDPAVRSYLGRSGFISTLKSIVKFNPEDALDNSYDHLRGSNPSMIEVTKIETGSSLPDLLNQNSSD